MDANILRKVKEGLKAKFYVANELWLNDCVEYYLSDHEEASANEVLEFVVSQWQLSDLREICNGKPCLPPNLAEEKCTTLRGHFILQMEKVYDITESKYKQLQKIQKVSDENVQATEDDKTQPWESKKKRMLYLHLSDGNQDITAMEYKPIRFLSDDLLPGYKLMIKGPVTCRRGVIMLDETNVCEIGGEVEKLLIPNALENVLARALNLRENPDPYNDDRGTKAEVVEDVVFDDDFDIDFEHLDLIENENRRTRSKERRNPTALVTDQQVVAAASDDHAHPEPLKEETDSDLIFDLIDENVFIDPKQNPGRSLNVAAANRREPPIPALPDENDFTFDQDDFMDEFSTTSANIEERTEKIGTPTARITEESRPQFAKQPVISSSSRIDPVSNIKTSMFQAKSPKILTMSPIAKTNSRPLSLDRKPMVSSIQSPMRNDNGDKKFSPMKTVEIGSKRVAPDSTSHVPAEKIRCTQSTPKVNKAKRKITDYLTKNEPMECAPTVQQTYDRISDILMTTVNDVVRKTVKAKVADIDKLSKNGQFWQLNATISDGTGTIDVSFASELLQSMLGLSVAEFSRQKKIAKVNQEIANQLRQSFRSAENRLLNSEDCLEIELAPDKKPMVVNLTKLSDDQPKMIIN